MFKQADFRFSVWAVALLAGCGAVEPAIGTVRGEVQNDQGMAVEGAMVSAYRVESDGSLTPTSSESSTDSSGAFWLDVDLESGSATDLVVVASEASSSFSGKVIMSGELSAGEQRALSPITVESSVEADMYIEGRSQGSWTPNSNTAQLRLLVDADLSAAISGSADYTARVRECALAASAWMEAHARMMVDSRVGGTSAQLQLYTELMVSAQAAFDEALAAAQSQTEIDAAYDVYFQATVNAYLDAGLIADQAAATLHAAVEASLTYASTLSAEVRSLLLTSVERLRAELVARATAEAFAGLQASAVVQAAVADAGVTLQTQVEAAASAGAQTQSALRSAWATFQAEIEAQLQLVVGGAMSLVSQIRTSVESVRDSVQLTLEQLQASATVDATVTATVDACGLLFASVHTEAHTQMLVGNGMTAAEASAVLSTLIHVDFPIGH